MHTLLNINWARLKAVTLKKTAQSLSVKKPSCVFFYSFCLHSPSLSSPLIAVLGIKLKALHMLSKCPATELHHQPLLWFIFWAGNRVRWLKIKRLKSIHKERESPPCFTIQFPSLLVTSVFHGLYIWINLRENLCIFKKIYMHVSISRQVNK